MSKAEHHRHRMRRDQCTEGKQGRTAQASEGCAHSVSFGGLSVEGAPADSLSTVTARAGLARIQAVLSGKTQSRGQSPPNICGRTKADDAPVSADERARCKRSGCLPTAAVTSRKKLFQSDEFWQRLEPANAFGRRSASLRRAVSRRCACAWRRGRRSTSRARARRDGFRIRPRPRARPVLRHPRGRGGIVGDQTLQARWASLRNVAGLSTPNAATLIAKACVSKPWHRRIGPRRCCTAQGYREFPRSRGASFPACWHACRRARPAVSDAPPGNPPVERVFRPESTARATSGVSLRRISCPSTQRLTARAAPRRPVDVRTAPTAP